jgi:hypothetical protein
VSLARRGAALIVAAAALSAAAAAQSGPETFTATASVKKGGASATAPLRLTITRYADDAERAAASKAVREGGATALSALLARARDAGTIEIGERRTVVKFAGQRPIEGGRLITLVTAEPILHLGAGVGGAKPTAGFDVAVAMLEVKDGGVGIGDLSPAAKVSVDDGGALLVEDYGATVVWLNGVVPAR